MNIFESIILGLVQGLTEFLPISSSGHLVIVREFLNINTKNALAFDVFLNTATLFAVIFCFWGDLKRLFIDFKTEGFSGRSKKLILAIILGTIPAGIIGFFFGNQIENIFRENFYVAVALIFGSLIMFLAEKINKNNGITPTKGFFVGLFQALALIPGISRSGSSISGGLIVGLSREEAIRFSFLLLIPVSLGALLKIILDIESTEILASDFFNLKAMISFLTALISGIWAVRFLVRYLSKNSFLPFIIYRLILAIIILIWF